MKRADTNIVGTKFFGATFKSTINQLALVIGEPDFENQFPGLNNQTNYLWNCRTDKGSLFTIYDFDMDSDFAADGEVEFRIGSITKEGSVIALEELSFKIVEFKNKYLDASFSPIDVEQALGRTIR